MLDSQEHLGRKFYSIGLYYRSVSFEFLVLEENGGERKRISTKCTYPNMSDHREAPWSNERNTSWHGSESPLCYLEKNSFNYHESQFTIFLGKKTLACLSYNIILQTDLMYRCTDF